MASTTVKTYSHVLKAVDGWGPDPAAELRNIVRQCRRDPNAVAWLWTLNSGNDFFCGEIRTV